MNPLKYVIVFIVLALVQVQICNNILLFGVAVPFIFIYFILFLPLNLNLNILMVVAFLLGLTIDVFSDTPGLNSLSCLVLATVRKPVFYAYMPKEDKFLNIIPGITAMGWENYIKYALSMSLVYCILAFGIEFFGWESFWHILLMIVSSAILTFLLLLATDSLINRQHE